MSSDIYIDMANVVTRTALFTFRCAFNVDTDEVVKEYANDEPDLYWIESCMQPVVLCKFGHRETWRVVDISVVHNGADEPVQAVLHVSCSGDFRAWLGEWLRSNNIPFDIH